MRDIAVGQENDKLIARIFRRSMIPVTMSRMIMFLGPALNGIIISRFLGTDSLAAYGLYVPFMYFVLMISQVFASGVQSACAISLGAGKIEDARRYYSSSMALLIAIAGGLTVILWCFSEPIAGILGAKKGASAALQTLLEDYLSGLSLGLIAQCMLPTQLSVKVLEGNRKAVVKSVTVQTVTNIGLGLLNVFFLGGGMLGMGLASSVGYICSVFCMMYLFPSKKNLLKFKLRDALPHYLPRIIKIGLPSAADRFYKGSQIYVVNQTLLMLAPGVAVAAFAGVNALNNIFNPVIIGITECTFTIAGIFLGERDRSSLERLMKFSVREIFVIEAVTVVIAFFAAPLLVSILVSSDKPEVFEATVTAFRIFALYLPVYGVNHILQKYYHGTGKLKMTYIMSAMDNFIYICLMVVLLGKVFGVIGVWSAFVVSEILTSLSLMLIVACMTKKSPFNIANYLMLPDDFDVPEKREWSANNMKDILAISAAAQDYCLKAKGNRKEALLIAMTIEEMGSNIIRWSDWDERRHSIDVRIFYREGWFVRIRDNTPAFDPQKWLELHRNESGEHNIGLRLISGLAKDMKYVSSMGMNNLTIQL